MLHWQSFQGPREAGKGHRRSQRAEPTSAADTALGPGHGWPCQLTPAQSLTAPSRGRLATPRAPGPPPRTLTPRLSPLQHSRSPILLLTSFPISSLKLSSSQQHTCVLLASPPWRFSPVSPPAVTTSSVPLQSTHQETTRHHNPPVLGSRAHPDPPWPGPPRADCPGRPQAACTSWARVHPPPGTLPAAPCLRGPSAPPPGL